MTTLSTQTGATPRPSSPPQSEADTASNAPQRPARAFSVDELRKAVAAGVIDTILLAVPDLQGRLKGKRYGARHFLDRVLDGGAEMCAYLLATDVDMTPADGFALTSWTSGYEDMTVVPDPSTLRTLPWMPRTALILGNAIGLDEEPIEIAPRQILRHQLTRLAAHGLHAQAGLETEFMLYRGTNTPTAGIGPGGLTPVTEENLDYALDHTPDTDRLFRRLQGSLSKAGMPVEAIKTEGAPGQVEVTFPYGPALPACDNHLVFKHAVRTLAGRSSMTATFMASPQTGLASGLHLHISLTRSGNPMITDPTGRLSEIGEQAIAGLLTALPGLAPLYAPNVNSYKRYVPGSFAPTRMTWGWDNRTCAVRVTGHGPGVHLEIRVPGADANPYLALSAALASIIHGIERQLTPPAPCTANAYEATDAALLPLTLDQARSAFRHSPIAQEALGKDVVEHYAHLAQLELDHHRGIVTDTEQARWFTRA
ncbi:glutamine synthetase family protein [Streptomyces sp. NBC_01216]|uniref:glutamine synthetase family protein n=1 Tax=Streptomyces sp. NBC_01216 TaxID=2903778 RepID=UPI002E1344F1|nr:glutamine synthetase family protein [Streptomyces sp. NBC_01216]